MPDEVNVSNEIKRLFDEKAPAILWHCIPREGMVSIRGEFFFSGPLKEHRVEVEAGIATGVELSDETLDYFIRTLTLNLAKAFLEWRP